MKVTGINLLLLANFFAFVKSSQFPEVSTSSGPIIGITHPESHAFYSVPYGEAPVGDLRFKPPVAISNQRSLNKSSPVYRRCFEASANCESDDSCNENFSEDCLFLDINVPSTVDLNPVAVTGNLPVLFWIHGGAFSYGSSTELQYDGRYLANLSNTIVVSPNYRLDALGCLVYEEGDERLDGNQGIKDQQLALKWVQSNIEKFGGNKNEVTIFGESAGGQSVTMHLMSATSRPLFKRAIIQSYRAALSYETKDQAKLKTELLLEAIDCKENKLQCLKNTPAFKLMEAHRNVVDGQDLTFFDKTQPYRPVLDEDEFTHPPLEYFQSGEFWKIDKEIIIGTTSDEAASIKVDYKDQVMTKEMFREQNIRYAGSIYGPIGAEKYMEFVDDPNDPNYDYTDLLAQEVADMMFICPIRALARFMLNTGVANLPLSLYVFDFPLNAHNCDEILGWEAPTQCYYASHASELKYVFNSGPTTGLNLTEDGRSIAKTFNEFWGNFAHTGIPTNDPSIWPLYREVPQNPEVDQWTNIRIKPETFIEDEYRSDVCDFWDSTGFYVNLTDAQGPTTPAAMETTSGADQAFLARSTGAIALVLILFVSVVALKMLY